MWGDGQLRGGTFYMEVTDKASVGHTHETPCSWKWVQAQALVSDLQCMPVILLSGSLEQEDSQNSIPAWAV